MTEMGLCVTAKNKNKFLWFFCNYKYNKQTKVNEILASPYERQRTQTDMFYRISYCVIQTQS